MKRTDEELRKAFDEQIDLLKLNCRNYDEGHKESWLSMSVVLRTILLGSSGDDPLINIAFNENPQIWSSIEEVEPELEKDSNVIFSSFMLTELSTNGVEPICRHEDVRFRNRKINMDKWLSESIYVEGDFKLSRKVFIKTVANKCGGAHVTQKKVTEESNYKKPLDWIENVDAEGKKAAELIINGKSMDFSEAKASLRQISEEVINSL